MSRVLRLAGAQMGPNQKADSREAILARMIALLEQAAAAGAKMVVFPELPLTTFFPRWLFTDQAELDSYFEREMPNPRVQPLFDRARALGIGFYLGYAELTPHGKRYNTAITVGPNGSVLGKYRKIHLPGTVEPRVGDRFQQLEKRYFEYGDLGFPAFRGPDAWGRPVLGMLICNDRRWPEAWRVMGLQQVELVMLGYNTPSLNMENRGFEAHHLRVFHSHLSIQSGCYQNSCFAVATAKAGTEDGHELFGHSIIVNPQGEIMAQATSWDDELIVAEADLGKCELGRKTIFDFARHRRPEHYGRIAEQVGSVAPAEWKGGA